jgi:hypothetical protein
LAAVVTAIIALVAAVFMLSIIIMLSQKIRNGLAQYGLRVITFIGAAVGAISVIFSIAEPTNLGCNLAPALHMLAYVLCGSSLYPQAYRQGKVAREELLLTSDTKLFYRALTITGFIAVVFSVGLSIFPYEASSSSLALGSPSVLVNEKMCKSKQAEVNIVVLLLQVGWLLTVVPHCFAAMGHAFGDKSKKSKGAAVVDWTPGFAFLTLTFTVCLLILVGMMGVEPVSSKYANTAFLLVGALVLTGAVLKPVVDVFVFKKTSKRVRPSGKGGAESTHDSDHMTTSEDAGSKAMLRLPVVRAAYQLYLIQQHVGERVEFEDRVEEFLALCGRPGVDQAELRSCFVKIIAKFVKQGADTQVNLSEKCRTPLEYLAGDEATPVTATVFNKAFKELQNADDEMFLRFVDTDLSAMSQQVTNWLQPFSDLDQRVKRGVVAQLSQYVAAEEAVNFTGM